jgi:hypothetical protein
MLVQRPFRVRRLGASGDYVSVGIERGDLAKDVGDAVAATVGLAPGTFVLQDASGVKSPPRGTLVGDWDVVPLPTKRITLLVKVEDARGERVTSGLLVEVATRAELSELAKRHGGGSLVPVDSLEAVHTVEALVEGGVYTLVGGQQEAVTRHRTWTQASNRAFELAATLAVHSAAAAAGEPGPMLVRSHLDVRNRAGAQQELDGLVSGTASAFVVEAKHSAQLEHVDLVIGKTLFVERAALEGSVPGLGRGRGGGGGGGGSGGGGSAGTDSEGVGRVFVPVLAATLFPDHVERLCRARCVGVVKPNGNGLSFFPAPALAPAAARRGLRTLALLLRRL